LASSYVKRRLCQGGRNTSILKNIKGRNFNAPGNIKNHIRALNRIRQENPALQDWRNILILNAWNDNIMAFAKLTPARDNCVMALVNLDPHNAQECTYEVPLWEFGLPDHAARAGRAGCGAFFRRA
jgi:starch synthase (maltosyl-transferring)